MSFSPSWPAPKATLCEVRKSRKAACRIRFDLYLIHSAHFESSEREGGFRGAVPGILHPLLRFWRSSMKRFVQVSLFVASLVLLGVTASDSQAACRRGHGRHHGHHGCGQSCAPVCAPVYSAPAVCAPQSVLPQTGSHPWTQPGRRRIARLLRGRPSPGPLSGPSPATTLPVRASHSQFAR